MALHSALSNAELHVMKGASTATSGQLPVANGTGDTVFTTPTLAVTAPNVTATFTEANRALDVSGRLVAAGGTLNVTEALHDGKTILLDTAAGSVCTLPAASGSGARFRFNVKAIATSNSHIVKVAGAADIIQGAVVTVDQDTAGTVTGWVTASDSDTVTLNRTTTGSVTRGEFIELEDVATNLWTISGVLTNTAAGATPFSATV